MSVLGKLELPSARLFFPRDELRWVKPLAPGVDRNAHRRMHFHSLRHWLGRWHVVESQVLVRGHWRSCVTCSSSSLCAAWSVGRHSSPSSQWLIVERAGCTLGQYGVPMSRPLTQADAD